MYTSQLLLYVGLHSVFGYLEMHQKQRQALQPSLARLRLGAQRTSGLL
jgi:hypothetical protein